MKSILKILCAVFIASSAFFFIGGAGEANAVVCPPGLFPHLDGEKVECKNPVKGGEKDGTGGEEKVEENIDGIKSYFLVTFKIIAITSTAVTVMTIVYSGYLYMTSEGDQKKTDIAKQTMIRAGIGVLVISISFSLMTLLTTTVGVSW